MSCLIDINNVTVDFPIYTLENKSIRHTILNGGKNLKFEKNSTGINVIRSLDSLSLKINKGDRICIIGENGSGKSTLLRVISGIIFPTSGSVTIKKEITPLIDLTLGIDFEATGLENITIKGLLSNHSLKNIEKASVEIIEFSELGQYIDLPVRMYSSGMVMRLAFAIATTFMSNILVMDEWLTVGDPKFREKATARLNKIIGNSEALVLATNDHSLIARVANKVLVLDSGKLVNFYTL
jgi:lipopolysaccharide transport system ATP-binding protein